MLRLKTLAHLDNKALRQKMLSQKDIRLFQYWQIIHCVHTNPGKKAEEYAALLGIEKEKVYRIVQQYNKKGKDFDLALQWGGRRERRSLLSLEEEQQMMKALDDLPPDYAMPLRLRFLDDMPLNRIAAFMGIPLSTVKWRIHHGKKLLRAKMN